MKRNGENEEIDERWEVNKEGIVYQQSGLGEEATPDGGIV